MAHIKTNFGTVEFTDTVGKFDHPVVASVWEKEGKCRVYFKVLYSKGSEQCGYYDVIGKIGCIRSSPAAWGNQIKGSIIHEASAQVAPNPVAKAGTFNTGLGYYGTKKDILKGFDGIE